MNDNLLKAHVFYFKKFLPTVAFYLIVSPTDGSMELTKPVQYSLMGRKEPNCCKLVLGHMDPTPNINEPEVNVEKQGYKGSNNKPQHLPNEETLDPKGSDYRQELIHFTTAPRRNRVLSCLPSALL